MTAVPDDAVPTSGPDLAALRARIDALDAELVRVLDDRARVAEAIGHIKQGSNQPFFAPAREREVIARARGLSDGTFPRAALEVVMREVMSASRALLAPTRVGVLGAAGSFTHLAARLRFGTASTYTPLLNPSALLAAVEDGSVDFGVFSTHSLPDAPTFDALDLFLSSAVQVFGEFVLDRGHCLVTREDTRDVTTVYGHAGSFALCQRWVDAHLSGTRFVAVASGLDAAERALAEPGAAALGLELLADCDGLEIRERGLDDVQQRRRFHLLSLRDPARGPHEKTALLFALRYEPGSLARLLLAFADAGCNLAWIEIRTSVKHPWQHVFLIEVEGHKSDPAVAGVLQELPAGVEYWRVLGSYPADL